MAAKWMKLSDTEYILKTEFSPPHLVIVVQMTEQNRWDGIITHLHTMKRIVSARPLALATMKRNVVQTAKSDFWVKRIAT